ncbi:MAG: hypothetical protein V4723_19960 [Pseudomonadota bacterium]
MTHPAQPANGPTSAPRNLRHDARCRDIVNHALAMQQGATTLCALEYLKAHGISAAVIERVLLEPQRRRSLLEH